jgi:hypothetical protein
MERAWDENTGRSGSGASMGYMERSNSGASMGGRRGSDVALDLSLEVGTRRVIADTIGDAPGIPNLDTDSFLAQRQNKAKFPIGFTLDDFFFVEKLFTVSTLPKMKLMPITRCPFLTGKARLPVGGGAVQELRSVAHQLPVCIGAAGAQGTARYSTLI